MTRSNQTRHQLPRLIVAQVGVRGEPDKSEAVAPASESRSRHA
jgi:hypothetical protein